MKRNLSFEEISDGKKYTKDDLVKVSCNGCIGCHECCSVTEDTILLDPYDIYNLSIATGKSFTEMLGTIVDLTVCDYVVTPYLKKREDKSCTFLGEDGRCSIHNNRPGFCRLFPLGRIYEDNGSFSYFIQVHECPYPNKTKVKVKQWLGIDRLSLYEDYIVRWHAITKEITAMAESGLDVNAANTKLLYNFFMPPYEAGSDFYEEFAKRDGVSGS